MDTNPITLSCSLAHVSNEQMNEQTILYFFPPASPLLTLKCCSIVIVLCLLLLIFFLYIYSGIGDIYGNLRPLTYMDPWLLPQLLHICPIQELDLLFLLVPVDYSAKYLVNMLKDSKSSLKKDQVKTFF